MTLDNSVDIDLGKEGRANKVSRRQVGSLFDYLFCGDLVSLNRSFKYLLLSGYNPAQGGWGVLS